MRRLFSTFAHGWPGMGLFVMRLVGGPALVVRAADTLHGGLSIGAAASVLAALAGLFLLAGLWTPVAGALAAATAVSFVFSQSQNPLADVLLATIGAALALVGPGAWSIDAHLFGWKRIDVPERTR